MLHGSSCHNYQAGSLLVSITISGLEVIFLLLVQTVFSFFCRCGMNRKDVLPDSIDANPFGVSGLGFRV